VGILQRIKEFWKKGERSVELTTGRTLGKIVDHPKIGIDNKEYERIAENFRYYGNDFPEFRYIDSFGTRKKRQFQSLNVTKTAARRLASIIFNEKCKITLRDPQNEERRNLKEASSFLEKTLTENNFYNLFEMNLEKGITAGGFAMRVYPDNEKIKISWIRADQFYPLRSNTNEISECAIATRTIKTEEDTNYYYTLLEFHEWKDNKYIITNELYKSESAAIVGQQVPLERLYPKISPIVVLENLQRPLFVYFRTPGANNKSLESPLGIGIVDNAKEILDTINLTHDQFSWEIQMGQRRVVVPAEFLKTDEAHPPMFDSNQNIFSGVYGAENLGIKDITTPIRTEQYKEAINHLIKEFEIQIGLSVGSMSYTSEGLKTATEIVSNHSMTYQTRSSYLTMVEKAIAELVHSIFELAGYAEFFPNNRPLFQLAYDSYQVDIRFEDGLFIDKGKQQEEDLKAVSAGIMPKKQFLLRNYNLSEKELEEWLTQLEAEQNSRNPTMDESHRFPSAEL
jgi:A118 family predicted phage portal protein